MGVTSWHGRLGHDLQHGGPTPKNKKPRRMKMLRTTFAATLAITAAAFFAPAPAFASGISANIDVNRDFSGPKLTACQLSLNPKACAATPPSQQHPDTRPQNQNPAASHTLAPHRTGHRH
jgi:hypothetical protein